MVRAQLGDRDILVTADEDGAVAVSKLPGATRTRKMPPRTWTMPLTCESIRQLRAVNVVASGELREMAARLMDMERYVETQKQSDDIASLRPVPIKPEFQLYHHQIRGYNIALALMGYLHKDIHAVGGSCALFADMGTGKTLTTIAVAGRLYLDKNIKRVLIISPSSVCSTWVNEFLRFADYPVQAAALLGTAAKRAIALRRLERLHAPSLRVAVINYESTWRQEDMLAAYSPDLIVCDESQRIKSHTAQQSKAMHRLGRLARFRMILTGTPIQQDPRDLWSQYHFLSPGLFHASYYAFQNRYCVFGGYQNHQLVARVIYTGGTYDTREIPDAQGRRWKIVSDSSIDAASDRQTEFVSPICTWEDIETVQELVRKLRQAGAKADPSCGIHVHVGRGEHTAKTLRNLVNMVNAKEDMLTMALDISHERRARWCAEVDQHFLTELNRRKPKDDDAFARLWYNEPNDAACEQRKRAHYDRTRYRLLNLHSVFQKGTIEFRAFGSTLHAGKIKAYIQLSLAISDAALKSSYASPTRPTTDNPKYAFRCWLLKLGFIGDEFATARQHLLANLPGNGAWRHGDPTRASDRSEIPA